MHKAAFGGHLKVIKFLSLMFGTRVHEKDSYGYNMLHWAAQEGHCEVARYLIEELKIDPQDRDKVCVCACMWWHRRRRVQSAGCACANCSYDMFSSYSVTV